MSKKFKALTLDDFFNDSKSSGFSGSGVDSKSSGFCGSNTNSNSSNSSKSINRGKTDKEIFEEFIKSQEGRHITEADGKYIVSRVIKGERKIFGEFTHYDYALDYEHNLIIHGWNDFFNPSNLSPFGKFITKKGNKFYITRNIDGKRINFGSYSRLMPALLKREELIDENWGSDEELNFHERSQYGKYITFFNGVYTITKKLDGKLYNFGYFDSLENATLARDILVQNNWDDSKVPERLYSWRFFIRSYPLFEAWEIFNLIDEDYVSFGLFKTLDIAKEALNILIDNGWNSAYVPLDYYHERSNIRILKRKKKEYFTVVRKVNDDLERFGSFYSYEEALEFRNELLLNNWVLEEEEQQFDEFIFFKGDKFTVKKDGVIYGEFDRICDAADFMRECIRKNWQMES